MSFKNQSDNDKSTTTCKACDLGGYAPYRGLTVLQKPPNLTGKDKGKAFPLPPPKEAASALVKGVIWVYRFTKRKNEEK